MLILSQPYMNALLKKRDENSNKNSNGHAFILAGNIGRMGAAVIASKACLRSGAGLLTVCVPKSERQILQTTLPEAMLEFREELTAISSKFSAIGIGPALGIDGDAKRILEMVLNSSQKAIVLDADALTILAGHPELLLQLPASCILTPHQNEFDRLFGQHENREQRLKTAQLKAKELNCIIVLKGPKTIIVTPDHLFQNATGNSGLAKAGSGDALTGMICSFLSQGYSAIESAKLAVYLHGLAADVAVQRQSVESLLISDVIECLGQAFEIVRD